ncbi:MAG: RagB/SusD family nutrient uptake outer membrane protein [Patiriisocius sp.]|uniref:RagB/SusD family nutrient uptake outer membrane protein n=1 Tax=Patiriisocius sp. TaxID=2822396 RepID=UPI003EFA3624
MKNILLIAIAVLSLSACSDYIEEENLSNENANYYGTEAGFNLLVNANYGQLRNIYGRDAYMFCAGTDLYAVGQGRGTEPEGLSQYTQLNSSSQGIDELYQACYQAIRTANTGLYYGDIVENNEGIDVSTLTGEIKYLRANAYFLLVQSFGGVGLVTEYSEIPVLSFDRNSAEEVYNQIILDLTDALNTVADGAYMGRVNKRAVQHLLAKVYLTRAYESFGDSGDFATAASYAEDAIAGQALSPSFTDLWFPQEDNTNDFDPEILFSVQFDPSSVSVDPTGLGHKQANWFSSYLGGSEVAGDAPWRSYTLLATDFALSLFIEEDERYDATFMTEALWRYYGHFDGNNPTGRVRHYYVPQWVTQPEIDAYIAQNPETEIHLYGTYGAGVVSSDYQTIPAKKFDDPLAPFENDARVSTRDIVLSRLGDTYLIAAEAYLATNPGMGLNRLNAVRERAGLTTPLSTYDIDDLLDERARELFGEYHRWFDLKRTGKLVERASLYNYLIDQGNFAGANGQLKILRPIPQSALDLNQGNNYPQNPAYQ